MTSDEFKARLSGRLERAQVAVTSGAVEQLEAYYRLLDRWNAKINLTGLPLQSPTDETFDRLLVEPLAAARHVADAALVWIDLGSGGGSPAIPMKIVRSRAKLVMVESKARKASFLREAVRVLELLDVYVENARFEEVAVDIPETAQIVTARAIKADENLFAAARDLLSRDGNLLWFRSKGVHQAAPPGFRLVESVSLVPSSTAELAVLRVVPRGTK